ncbi:hypothetical protein EMPS_04664 [Entomortierella parvispora]|uniref:Uncharacterized protein n=1 Tax=Entomortierella parvispora TaxID=205924 RepID=A0A9P3LVR2_9FUNG|nr:hypothetical protein EMPS_04664 [Entomortierella parvispora]
MLSFENVARNAQSRTVPESMYDVVAVYLDSLPRHPRAFTPVPIQPLQWTLPFEPVIPPTPENTQRAPFTTKKALQNKSDPTRYSLFAEHNKPITLAWKAPQVRGPQWLLQPEAYPPPQSALFQNSPASWPVWAPPPPPPPPLPQQALQPPQPMMAWPGQPELPLFQTARAKTHRPPTLHSDVTNPTMKTHGKIPQETELTTAIQSLRIDVPLQSPNSSSREQNNHNGAVVHNKRRRNRKKNSHYHKEPVHKDTHVPPVNENEESPPIAVANISSQNKREERHQYRAAEGDEIIKTLSRGGHRGGRAGRGGRGSRRHPPVNSEQLPTQPSSAPPLFVPDRAVSTPAAPVASTTTPKAHPTTRSQQLPLQNNESFRHARKIGGNARRDRTDTVVAN